MAAEYELLPDISDEAQLEIIEHKWHKVAVNFREAGLALQHPTYLNRAAMVERRIDYLEQSDALLDARNAIMARLAIGGANV